MMDKAHTLKFIFGRKKGLDTKILLKTLCENILFTYALADVQDKSGGVN